MTPMTIAPILLDDVTATLDGTDYAAAVSTVELVPTAATVRWQGMTPTSSHVLTALPDWVLNLGYAQDWSTPGSLSAMLLERVGQVVGMTFQPKKGATGPTVTAEVLVTPGAIGGKGRAVAEASVSLMVLGQPDVTPTPPTD